MLAGKILFCTHELFMGSGYSLSPPSHHISVLPLSLLGAHLSVFCVSLCLINVDGHGQIKQRVVPSQRLAVVHHYIQ